MAAYDRALPSTTQIAVLLKRDDPDPVVRPLLDGLAKILNKNYATIQSDSIATLAAALVSAGIT